MPMFTQHIDPDAIILGWLEPNGIAGCSRPFRLDQCRSTNLPLRRSEDSGPFGHTLLKRFSSANHASGHLSEGALPVVDSLLNSTTAKAPVRSFLNYRISNAEKGMRSIRGFLYSDDFSRRPRVDPLGTQQPGVSSSCIVGIMGKCCLYKPKFHK